MDDVVGKFDRVAKDGKIAGLILKIENPKVGWAKMRALRSGIAKVQGAGKKVYAYLDEADNMDFLLATACDEVCMPEAGVLTTLGVRAEVTFYKKAFDLLGVKAEMLRVGEFKSAGEPYSRTDMSPEFRKEMEEILDDFFQQLVTGIAESRKLPADVVRDVIDNAPITARQALEKKLIDRVGYQDELESAIAKLHEGKKFRVQRKYGKKKMETDLNSFAGMMKFMETLMGIEPPKRKSTNSKLAIIHAQGMIMTGKSTVDFMSGESTMGSDTMIKAIRDAREDATVKAIVLRIDSPGGSALASDLMWHELERVEKPFVVSMGDVAASGGYYIAMGADRVFAEPGTITGSIGVVGMKLALGGVMEKVGVTTDVISRGKNSGILSSTQGYSEGERAAMQKILNEIYAQFTAKAAQGRKMPVEQLEKLARGRVYTGNAALKIGLVDEIGGIDAAIAHAKKLAGLNPEDKLERLDLPKASSPFESLFGNLDPNSEARADAETRLLRRLTSEYIPEATGHFKALGVLRLFSKERSATMMPFDLRVR
ncbi:MAG: signal peptide peptidase SppA [Planctomycetota bacterium]|nr:signal peptide peptidase SppA [Planctomycetota bacterium]